MIAAAIVVVALAAGGLWFVLRSEDEPVATPRPTLDARAVLVRDGLECRDFGPWADTLTSKFVAIGKRESRTADPATTRFWMVECVPTDGQPFGGYLVVEGESPDTGRTVIVFASDVRETKDELTETDAVVLQLEARTHDDVRADLCATEQMRLVAALETYRAELGDYPNRLQDLVTIADSMPIPAGSVSHFDYSGDPGSLQPTGKCLIE